MSSHGCLPTTFKFTGWIIALLQLAVIIPVVITIKEVPPETKVYVDSGLYHHKGLINVHSRLYVKQLFRHFEAHFVAKGIGDWHHSRWPQLLQDLDLLPEQYKVTLANQDRRPLSAFWTDWHGRSETVRQQEVAPPLNSQVRIPVPLMCLFDGEGATGTIRYGEVLAAAQEIVDNQYNIYSKNRKTNLKNSLIKKYRVLAFFGLTVFDQFLGAVENQTRTRLVIQVPRTRLVPELVAGHRPPAEQVPPSAVQPPPAEPNLQPVPPQMANPTGGRGGVNPGEGAAVPLAPPQAARGPSSGSVGNLEHMSPAKAPNSAFNKGIVPVAVAWKPWQAVAFQILDSMKEPIYRRDIHHWPGHFGGSYSEQGEAGPLVPGTSGGGGVGGNAAAARAPNREAKRKATDQGGGPSHGGKRGPGGAMMRSMGHVHKAHHHARQFKSGAKSQRGHGHRA